MGDLNIENACSTSAGKPIGTTSLSAASCNLSHLDNIANSDDLTSTNRRGRVDDTVAGFNAKVTSAITEASQSFGFVIQGSFASGFTITNYNQLGQDASGDNWRYRGSTLPFVVAAGTTPSAPDFEEIEFSAASGITYGTGSVEDVLDDLTDGTILINDLSQAYEFNTLDDAINFNRLIVGKVCRLAERTTGNGGGALWDTYASGTFPVSSYVVAHATLPLQLALRVESVMGLEAFGVLTGALDNTTTIQDAVNHPNVVRLTAKDGSVFRYTSDITCLKNLDIFGNFTFKSENNAQFVASGSLTDMGDLSSGGGQGQNIISTGSSVGFSDDSLLIIHNQVDFSFSKHRANYHDGEFNLTQNINGANLDLVNALSRTYPVATTTKVFLVNDISVKVDGVKFIETFGQSPVNVLTIQYARKVRINANVFGGVTSALYINKCFDIKVNGGTYINKASATGLQYGIAFINCQDADVNLANCYGTRHGVTTGSDGSDGAVPNRNIRVNGSNIANDRSTNVYSADFHGNTVDSGYYDCNISNDMGLGGENISAERNTITSNRVNPPIELQEVVGGVWGLKDNKVKVGAFSAFARVVGFGSSVFAENVDRDFTIDIDGIETEISGTTTTIMQILSSAVGGVKSRYRLNRCTISGVDSALTSIISGAVSNSAGHVVPPIRPESVRLTSLDYTPHPTNVAFMAITAGAWAGCKVTMPTFTASTSLTAEAGQWFSNRGGSADTGLFVFNYPDYPGVPRIQPSIEGWPRGNNPQFIPSVDLSSITQAQVYFSTSDSSLTTGSERTLSVMVTASMQDAILS